MTWGVDTACWAGAVFLGCLGLGCKKEHPPRPFAGVYEIERVTVSSSGCDHEGAVSKSDAKFLYLHTESVAGVKMLSGGTMTSQDEANRAFAGESLAMRRILYFDSGVDTASPTGRLGESAMPNKNGMCVAKPEIFSMRRADPDGVHIEIRTIPVEYPGKELRDCGTGPSLKAAEGKPCTELTVIDARAR